MTQAYFVYSNPETQQKYYFNVQLQTSTYDFPYDGIVYDPETNQPIYVPQEKATGAPKCENVSETVEENRVEAVSDKKTENLTENSEMVHAKDDAEITKESPTKSGKHRSGKKHRVVGQSKSSTESKNILLSVPMDNEQILKCVDQYSLADFAKANFNVKTKTIDAAISFSDQVLDDSLLNYTESRHKKRAIIANQIILNYIGVVFCKNSESQMIELAKLLNECPDIADDVYFQLIRLTRRNPSPTWTIKSWELLLMVSTLFPSTKKSDMWIKSFLAIESYNPDPRIAQIAQFISIRFDARSSIGKPGSLPKDVDILSIPKAYMESKSMFAVSIYEVMWSQKHLYPKCPFPFVVHLMASRMIDCKCYNMEGLFRLPGNMKIVEEAARRLNISFDVIQSLQGHDIGSLFKMWFRELPNQVIPQSYVPAFVSSCESGKPEQEILSKLPPTHYFTLKYLIGFLQEMAKYMPITKMGSQNLAMVFGPNIINLPTDPALMKKTTSIAVEFLKKCIDTLDTSDIYPLPAQFI